MSVGLPGRRARILARIEAELRESDARFAAMFALLGEAGGGRRAPRSRAGPRLAQPLAATLAVLVLVLATALTGARIAGWQACPPARGCLGITGFAGREVAVLQARTAGWGRDIRAVVCQPARLGWRSPCG